jgi:hypothetical protein
VIDVMERERSGPKIWLSGQNAPSVKGQANANVLIARAREKAEVVRKQKKHDRAWVERNIQ